MKKHVFTLITLTSALFGAGLQANECCDSGAYVSGLGGVNFLKFDKNGKNFDAKTGYMAGASVGYKFEGINIRTEAEFSYRNNAFKVKVSDVKVDGRTETYAFMGNVYYDFDLDCAWTPYVGLGAGYAHQMFSAYAHKTKLSIEDNGFAYQGIAGVSYKLCEKTHAALEYRYFASSKHVKDHSIVASVKRYF